MNNVLALIVPAQTTGNMILNSIYATSKSVTLQFTLFNEGKPWVVGQRTFLTHVVFEDYKDLIEELWASPNLLDLSDT